MKSALWRAVLIASAVAAAGCTSSQDVLEPSAIAAPALSDMSSPQSAPAPAPFSTSSTAAPAESTRTASLGEATRIQFAPVVGATVETATPLTERLAQQARARGITLARSDDPAATHVLKGYFSVLSENGTTTVVYVWDVYDPSGARLHRITGQQSSPAGKTEGWASVSPDTMRTIADQTMDAFSAWVDGQAG
jgi:hypothetical protein